jgi:hypothetical protein
MYIVASNIAENKNSNIEDNTYAIKLTINSAILSTINVYNKY